MKFSIKDFFSKCDQIPRKLRIWSHYYRNPLMENFIFCAVRLNKFPLLKAGSRGAHENWFLNIFKSTFYYNFQLDYHSYGSYLHFFPGCFFTGTCYCYSHFVVLNKGSHLKSQNEALTLRLQEDCNLVLSCLNSPILVFQENGNLAILSVSVMAMWQNFASHQNYFYH